MEVIDGVWIMKGLDFDDPHCLHDVDELVDVINDIGFLPLFSNGVEGFSVEEMTYSDCWWCGDEEIDPWEWRAIIAREEDIAYGKFFNKKAGFISKKWLPYFANYRRDGYDFDAAYEDGKAAYREKLIMDLFLPDNKEIYEVNVDSIEEDFKELISHEVKKNAGFGKGGEKNFDGTIANLMMGMYLMVNDFRRKVNKRGEEYGWALAVYTMPEYIWGYDYVTSEYSKKPEESFDKLVDNVKKHFKDADIKEIKKILEK